MRILEYDSDIHMMLPMVAKKALAKRSTTGKAGPEARNVILQQLQFEERIFYCTGCGWKEGNDKHQVGKVILCSECAGK